MVNKGCLEPSNSSQSDLEEGLLKWQKIKAVKKRKNQRKLKNRLWHLLKSDLIFLIAKKV